ncbi:oxidoreductase [Catellatospora sp. TT07R-123]|uniref:aldo/keto reductase n=1 Tax=Catellatospora sp. TT07R-123 TaxID=2733863 RepID=UPI001B0EAC30|nr:aldo/keto reductase [Catellatospora sp. TT07R-123]GHJ49208.1 oxidoreductase [Catellatospora sp. TT07R-123]
MPHQLGRSRVTVGPLGLGAASIGNLYRAVPDDRAAATVDAAWQAGVRYFDTAPHYGLGLSERRLGQALAARPREEYVLSTKVGRVLVDNPAGAGANDLANGFDVPAGLRREWDFSSAGIHRSIEDSLRRLGLDRIDLVLIHDPEESPDAARAVTEAYPALHELRDQGVIGAVGVGSKDTAVLTRFAVETDVDALMVAGRYTLLEQPALDDLLPVCAARGISMVNVGVFNSGLLAVDWPDETRPYEYGTVPADILARAQAIALACRRHGVALPQAALAFAAAHPCVASVVVGAGRPENILRSADLFARPVPPELWTDLVAEGLLRPDAPTP